MYDGVDDVGFDRAWRRWEGGVGWGMVGLRWGGGNGGAEGNVKLSRVSPIPSLAKNRWHEGTFEESLSASPRPKTRTRNPVPKQESFD